MFPGEACLKSLGFGDDLPRGRSPVSRTEEIARRHGHGMLAKPTARVLCACRSGKVREHTHGPATTSKTLQAAPSLCAPGSQ